MDIDECEEILSKFEIPAGIAVRCQRWDGDVRTRTARGYFTAEPLESPKVTDDVSGLKGVTAHSTVDESTTKISIDTPVIILFPERVYGGEKEMIELLSHELVHAYDHCVLRRDLTKCEELACSEIRAAREAECLGFEISSVSGAYCRLLGSGTAYCDNVKRSCVARIATRSTRSVFQEDKARDCVQSVFDRCYSDIDIPKIRIKKDVQ